MKKNYILILDILAMFSSTLVVILAFVWQLYFSELPCALCNLQRLAFLLFGAGMLVVILYPKHYRVGYCYAGISALVGIIISMVQVFVHILPNSSSTGSAILGIHMYAWSSLLYFVEILYVIIMQCVDTVSPKLGRIIHEDHTMHRFAVQPKLIKAVIMLFFIVCIAAFISALFENGFNPFLAGGQQHYWITEFITHHGPITEQMLMGESQK